MLTPSTFRAEARQQPVLWAVLGCFAVETGANAIFGWRYAGGMANAGGAAVMAVAGVCIAYFGADMAARFRGMATLGARLIAGGLVICCLLLSQIAGLRLMGVTMADGAARRDKAALQSSSVTGDLKRKEAALEALGVQPAPSRIEEEIKALQARYLSKAGKTIGEATNGCADPGWAPDTCKKVAEARVRLADAQRAAELDREIKEARGAVGRTDAVATGDPDLQVLARIIPFATVDDIKFWLPVFIVALIGTIANLGWLLIGYLPPSQPLAPAGYLPMRTVEMAPYVPPAPREHDHATAAPIHQTFHFAGSTLSPAQAAGAVPNPAPVTAAAPVPVAPPPSAPVTEPAIVTPPSAAAGPSPEAPSVPVDRDPVKRLVDNLLTFKAACCAAGEEPVPLDALYTRYVGWAQGRAMPKPAFQSMFPEAAGCSVCVIGGVPHVTGVALRKLAMVAGE